MNESPVVSIIVRTKDRPKLLKRALQSIASQTYRPIEVVLVNDGGCDLAIEELKTILGDVSLNYQRLEKNMGRSHAGNVGIENTKGKYVGFLDDDDVLYENHLEVLVGFLRGTDSQAAYTDALTVKNRPTKEGYQPFSKEITYARNFDKDWLLFQNYIPLMCFLCEKGLLLNEPFDTAFDLFEDWDLLIRLSRRAAFHRISQITAEYHIRDDNTVVLLNPETFAHVEARHKVYRKHRDLLTDRALSIFEALHAESERYRQLYQNRNAEFDALKTFSEQKSEELVQLGKYISEKEKELAIASAYIKEKEAELGGISAHVTAMEEELAKARAYIKEKEAELAQAHAYIKEKEEEREQSAWKRKGTISVVILTHNGEKHIRNLLNNLFSQEIDQPLEVIVIDSSSKDATADIVRTFDAKLHVIDKAAFNHAGTRNLGASLSHGSYVVMITQDAVPMNRFWLKELCRPFESIPNLAASYSRQIPQPDCNPLEAKDIYIGAPCVDEVRYADFGVDWQRDDYHGNIHRYIRFSNVSACYDGELLRANPFDEQLRMVEDQEWSRRMIEKGYATYYASKSVVVHSHNFSIGQVYRRHFDYGMSFRHFLPGSPPKRTSFLRATVFDYMNDVPYILNDNRRLWSKLKWICRSPFFRFAAHYGLYKGWRCA